jgi:hypothetical protein
MLRELAQLADNIRMPSELGTMADKSVQSCVTLSRAGCSSSDPILVNARMYLDPARRSHGQYYRRTIELIRATLIF